LDKGRFSSKGAPGGVTYFGGNTLIKALYKIVGEEMHNISARFYATLSTFLTFMSKC